MDASNEPGNNPGNSPDNNPGIYEWCQEIDPFEECNLYERLKSTGITDKSYNFNIYLRRRLPNRPLQHVKTWNNYLPGIEEIALTFGGGEAVLDFEVLYGRYSGKKKRSMRTVIRIDESYNDKKREYDKKCCLSA